LWLGFCQKTILKIISLVHSFFLLKVELNLNTNGEQKSTLVKSVIFTIMGGFFSLLLGLLILSEMKTNFPSNLAYIILIFVLLPFACVWFYGSLSNIIKIMCRKT